MLGKRCPISKFIADHAKDEHNMLTTHYFYANNTLILYTLFRKQNTTEKYNKYTAKTKTKKTKSYSYLKRIYNSSLTNINLYELIAKIQSSFKFLKNSKFKIQKIIPQYLLKLYQSVLSENQ